MRKIFFGVCWIARERERKFPAKSAIIMERGHGAEGVDPDPTIDKGWIRIQPLTKLGSRPSFYEESDPDPVLSPGT